MQVCLGSSLGSEWGVQVFVWNLCVSSAGLQEHNKRRGSGSRRTEKARGVCVAGSDSLLLFCVALEDHFRADRRLLYVFVIQLVDWIAQTRSCLLNVTK